ncbi:NAD(P)/FAD-dependent oxidoreductase [Pseudoduganella sp. FT25W]|uniref:NAD(P)/FAD-dependent oxidoreductase n=1 Tax=Duganella alba TaxID=2666081 RepID=A0A6L5QMZ4_9BURK|nr:FAD-dependent oxidoreductase [Duganella alba]MRX11194.1 NAD(P)/FAD-dependent oxidoreductase [Duganella alba]MRX19335.1 NAD(P)/FAD-dependent oxidoreductase [Duganella alba]
MTKQILIVGTGFSGMWSALAAARLRHLQNQQEAVEISIISPQPNLHIRPRLYEADLAGMAPSLVDLFAAAGVRHIVGAVEQIHPQDHAVNYLDADGKPQSFSYDKLVLASGSTLFRPAIPGLKEHAFSVDQLNEAEELQRHLQALPQRAASKARNTVVVCGGGFTGIETAAEMPARLRAIFGSDADFDVIVVEKAQDIGPDLGAGPRPVIEQSLRNKGVSLRLGHAVEAIDDNGVTIAGGERIEAGTVIWTAGARASALAAQVPGERDAFGRLQVTPALRVGSSDIYATGDVARAASDDQGNHALMSCQHAMNLGRSAGHNAMADVLGLPAIPYDQQNYVTCLALGADDGVYTEGWDRQVKLSGAPAAELKGMINTQWIYPPKADMAEIIALADPDSRPVQYMP